MRCRSALSWDLGDAVFNLDRIDVSREARLVIQLRDDVLDEVNQLYFERQRVLASLDAPPADTPVALLRLRAAELASGLDAWTGGWFSEQLAHPVPTVPPSPHRNHRHEIVVCAASGRHPGMCWLVGAARRARMPLLSEVFYDAVGTDDGLSFVELYGAARHRSHRSARRGHQRHRRNRDGQHRALGTDPGRRPVRDRGRAGRRDDAGCRMPT